MRFSLLPLAIALSAAFSVVGAETEPIVHMLVPGFTVRELPVRLSNINNLRFGPDGRLFALGYDGRVHALHDTNGDGLEDKDEIFWDKPTISVPVGMARSKDGLYVSSHGKVSFLRDTHGDGKADTEEIIASGWPPTHVGSGGVDATAVTLDKEGNVYFGLLVADYSNPYRLRKRKDLKPEDKAWLAAHGKSAEGDPEEEVSLYDLNGMRGTIQKWSPKTKKLETFATGIRVPYALAFNRSGDLFVTDQEGETWCPNGNPLDELNHIIPGRNYGFPPRHDKYLPNLISEPPVVGFGPQHQSTCGLVFNDPEAKSNSSPGRKIFGPKWWEGDAFVAGESRGKIWRVRLIKTPYGYVGKEYLIARLLMLTTDVTISPKGDLYVSCHSGLPDWGTGPQGEGKIFKISYTDPKAPQPVIAWAAGPQEVRVAFDKPLDLSVINAVTNQEIEFSEYVRAGDRYEVLKPPYEVVKKQEAARRGKIKITAAKLDNDGQTLVLSTTPHSQAVKYALTIPNVKAKGKDGPGTTVDSDYDLSGVQVHLETRESISKLPKLGQLAVENGLWETTRDKLWSGWLPSTDMFISEQLLRGSSAFSSVHAMLANAQVEMAHSQCFLRPPSEGFTLHASSTGKFLIHVEYDQVQDNVSAPEADQIGVYSTDLKFDRFDLARLEILPSVGASSISLSFSSDADLTPRPLPLANVLVPWCEPAIPSDLATHISKASINGGDWELGRERFFDIKLQCAKCHRVRGEGGEIGPDLSNLVSRDAASVVRDIKEPSASINPDYVAYNVALNNGSELTGFIRAQDNASIKLIGADGKETQFRPTEVKEMRPSSVSLMPTGLLDVVEEKQIRDLLTFLLNEPPKRTRVEINAALTSSNSAPAISDRTLAVVLVASKQDHGPGQHDYPAWQKKWRGLLTQAAGVTVTDAWEWPTQEQFQNANVLVFYFWNHDWSAERYLQLDEFQARGGGIVLLHAATIADKEPEKLAERIGLAAQPGPTKYLHMPLDLKMVAPTNHVITHGLPAQLHFLDEPYWQMFGDTNKIEVLATTEQEGKSWPMMWTFQRGKGRVFASILGHYSWTLDDPWFRILIFRGIAWAAGEPSARFEKASVAGTDSN